MEPSKSEHSKQKIALEAIEKKSIFQVPEAYFDKLPSLIQSRAAEVNRNKFQWTGFLRPSTMVPAACLLVIALMLSIYVMVSPSKKNERTWMVTKPFRVKSKMPLQARPAEALHENKTDSMHGVVLAERPEKSLEQHTMELDKPKPEEETVEAMLAEVDKKELLLYLEVMEAEDDTFDDISETL